MLGSMLAQAPAQAPALVTIPCTYVAEARAASVRGTARKWMGPDACSLMAVSRGCKALSRCAALCCAGGPVVLLRVVLLVAAVPRRLGVGVPRWRGLRVRLVEAEVRGNGGSGSGKVGKSGARA